MIVYDTPDYAMSRLHDTYIRGDDNHLVLVTRALWNRSDNGERGIVLEVRTLSGKIKIVPIEHCNLEPLPLGHINLIDTRQSEYLTRMPVRNDWRQGTRLRNIHRRNPGFNVRLGQLNVRHNEEGEFQPAAVPPIREEFWSAVDDCVNNKYPPLYEAQERVEDLFDSCAFSRRFRIDKRGQLIYKNRGVVGTCEVEPHLDNNHVWLSEVLEEEMANVEL